MKHGLLKKFVRISLLSLGTGFLALQGANGIDLNDLALHQFQYNALNNNAIQGKKQTFTESMITGVQLGVIGAINDVSKLTLSKTIVSSIDQCRSGVNAWYKYCMMRLHGYKGFDARELFGWRWILERSINTHISNVAKGARVVRAHVLEQQKDEKNKGVFEAAYGISALKRDIEYIKRDLESRINYYKIDYKHQDKSIVNRTLDMAAVFGAGYLGLNWLMIPSKKSLKEKRQSYIDRKHKTLKEAALVGESCVKTVKDVTITSNEAARNIVQNIESYTNKDLKDTFEQASSERQSCTKNIEKIDQKIAQRKASVYKDRIVKGVVGALVVARMYHWMKSQKTMQLIDTLSDVDRDMVVHLTETMISYLGHMSQLCDQIKEESDIARLKDEFEFISKNASETLIQIARIIDLGEANDLQKLGKPGQAAANFGQGGLGLGGALPYN